MAHVNYSSLSDSEVFKLTKSSDHFAYTEIYHRYFHLIYHHAFKKLRKEDVAKDVVQDVFTTLWMKRSAIAVESNLAGYLYTSVRNRIFNFWAHCAVESAYWDAVADVNAVENCVADTDHKVREQQLSDYIDRQITELPPKMKRIFLLSRREYLTHRQIAEQLNTSEENVSKQVGNALKILRAKLGIGILLLLLILAWVVVFVGSYLRLSFFSLIHVVYHLK
jgi:RNA polymerase sigma-70 factor (ECF subfamily)